MSTHATDADVPINAAINYLSTGSIQNNSVVNDTWHLWTNGQYGAISFGPGTYNVAKSIILKSNIVYQGSGMWNTIFKLANSHADNNNATLMKSSTWDTKSIAGGTLESLMQGDLGIVLRDFTVDGNKTNNATVRKTKPTPGSASWGHGIALYGVGHVLENISVKQCRGAGVILQGTATNVGDYNTGGFQTFENHLNNLVVSKNNQQGILLRQTAKIDRLWTFDNGEPGIEVQASAYFGAGNSFFNRVWCFFDSLNHGNQTTKAYDPTGPEIWLSAGIFYIYQSIIEAPKGMGDNLLLGRPGAPASSSDYMLASGSIVLDSRDVYFDGMRKYAIRMQPECTTCKIAAHINGAIQQGGTYYDESSGVWLNGCSNNNLDLYVKNLNASTNGAAVIMGRNDATGWVATNHIRLVSWDNRIAIDWVRPESFYNNIFAQVYSINTGAYDETTINAVSNLDGVTNNVIIQGTGNSSNSSKWQNGGTATFSGNGSTTAFNIVHGLMGAPWVYNVTPNTSAASGAYSITADDINIKVKYASAPASGTNNVKLLWSARMGAQ